MDEVWWTDDDRLLASLGEALAAARGVPRDFVAMGKAVYARHAVDAERAVTAPTGPMYLSGPASRRPDES